MSHSEEAYVLNSVNHLVLVIQIQCFRNWFYYHHQIEVPD